MYVRFVAVTDDVAALAEIPPGPLLAVALGRIDAAHVPNNALLALLAAQSRQAAHEAARLLGVIAEVGRATPTFDDSTVERLDHPVPHAADEVRAALAWSRRAADRECGFAEQLVHNVPEVYAAFLAGDIDRPKARVFADHLAGLTRAQIATVCEVLLPTAGRFTPGQLVVRLRRLVAAIDPRHYERRYRKALRDRTVCAWLDETGTAVFCARGLSPTQAQAAVERIDLMAHAARRAGHPSTLDQIRVDVLAGLLDGTLHHLDRDQIIAYLLTHRSGNDDPRQTDPGSDRSASGDVHEGVTGSTGDSCVGVGDHPVDDQRVGVEVRVALSTLFGRDEQPGEIPGVGPIPASHARAVVACQRRAEWRFAITDDAGRLLFDGTTRRRPEGLLTTGPAGGIVEVHVPATLLAELIAEGRSPEPPVARWATVLADIAGQYGAQDRRDLDAHPDDRLPRASLRRHTQVRDRTCVGVGCRRRPAHCDQDHTVEYQHGGPTVAADLAPLCRHDHLLKSQGGWTLQQQTPGTFVWTSPLGGRYEVRPEPILPPPPGTCPGPDDHRHDDSAPPGPDTLTVWRPACTEPEHEPIDLDRPHPF